MARRLVAGMTAGLVLGLASCGGGLSDSELAFKRADAAEAGYNIASKCQSGGTSEGEFSGFVDDMIDAYETSEKDSEVRSTARDAAGTLRTCDLDSLADRLNSATGG